MSSYTPKNRKFAFKGAVTILSAKITAGNQLPNHHINQYDVCQPLVSSSIYSDNLSISADEYFNRFHHLASMLPHKQDAPFPFVASYPQPSFANVYQQRAYSSKYAQRCIVTDLSKDMLPSRPVLCESSDDSAGSLPSSTTPAPFGFSSSLTSSHAPPSPAAHMISCSDRSSDLVPDVCLSKYRKLPPYYTPTSYPDDCYDDNNEGFNDAILPSSLNDLLTASELELRERQAHCQQQRQLMRGHSTQRSCQSHSPQESEASFFYPMNNNHTILVQMATDEGN
ncbi:uncharacterized protein BYT42DRAFT_586014 [Radiomyces spectabilis]|uniref:uncharacterized protein n=1 Tax=Radiomyces spectabilis TaxID=64574 RepID=UPI002220FAA3|nr:uncharacterized protein BYT42DRAFT_586014 [Radiomyces spectabilis]KAI8368275.1 hypothetical protein BYT42DRAFT_586014 [Radiomyces spectabilis]